MHRLLATLTFVLLLSFSAGASAQLSDKKLADINRVAMEAYNNLDIETAKKTLEDAIRGAERGGTHGPGLARTYANLGVVVVGGLGDSPAGVDAFMRALKEDSNVEPDPIVATPEVMSAFAQAKKKVASGAAPRPSAPPPSEAGTVEGNLSHTPVEEQLSQTAVPIFVGKGDVDAKKLKVFYRSLGMSRPKSADMQATDDGWIYLIPCTDVFEPTVEYFIIAEDDDGDQVGNAGTPEHPVSIAIVSTRTQAAPSLPGQQPPEQCATQIVDECPPGLPDCNAGKGAGQLGDTCRSSADCSSGLSCVDEFCSMDGAKKDDDDDKDSSDAPKWYVDVGMGLGATYVSEGKTPDLYPTKPQVDEALRQADPDRYLIGKGWDCEFQGATADACKVAVKKAGFVPVTLLNFALGRYLTPKFGLAVIGRFQLKSGSGPLAGMAFGVRADYLLGKPKAKGGHFGLLGGLMLGTMQARPEDKGPYASSAAQGGVGVLAQLGLRTGYRFTRNIGIQITPAFTMGLPRFLAAIDLTGGLELAF